MTKASVIYGLLNGDILLDKQTKDRQIIGGKQQKQRMTQNHGGDEDDGSNSSNYNDENFENDEDPLREDVSSEGSCIKSNSYRGRSSSHRGEEEDFNIIENCSPQGVQNHLRDDYSYYQEDEENIQIPDEEELSSPRKAIAQDNKRKKLENLGVTGKPNHNTSLKKS